MSMSEMRELFDLLKENGIQIDTGFSGEEIAAVENLYELSRKAKLSDCAVPKFFGKRGLGRFASNKR